MSLSFVIGSYLSLPFALFCTGGTKPMSRQTFFVTGETASELATLILGLLESFVQ